MAMVLGLPMQKPSHCRWLSRPDDALVQLAVVALMLVLHVWTTAAAEVGAPPMGLPGCPTTCGGITVPYPFGISPGCFLSGFNLTCDRSHNPLRLLFGDGATGFEVTGIYLNNATMRLVSSAIINVTSKIDGNNTYYSNWSLPSDGGGAFVLSYDHNRLVLVGSGCGLEAALAGSEMGYDANCSTTCVLDDQRHWIPTKGGGCDECSGNGCCQANISKFFPFYVVSVWATSGRVDIDLMQDVVLIAEKGWIEGFWCRLGGALWPYYKPPTPDISRVPVVLEWAMNSTLPIYPEIAPDYTSRCPADGASSACKSSNSICVNINSVVRSGYVCQCSAGYYGNPYLVDGCRDGGISGEEPGYDFLNDDFED